MQDINKKENLNTETPILPEIGAEADTDLLLDDILREFGDAQKKKAASPKQPDHEVQKILLSVKESFDDESAGSPADDAGKNTSAQPVPSEAPAAKSAPSEEHPDIAVQPDAEEEHSAASGRKPPRAPKQRRKAADAEEEKTRPTVKVVAEDDQSPLFGDNFAKYFGPEAGLATRIDVPGAEEEDEDEVPVKRRRKWFRRRDKKSEHAWDDSEAEEEDDETSDEEEIPEEIVDTPPDEAAKQLIAGMGFIRLKLLVSAILCVPLIALTFGPKLGLFIPDALTYVRNPYLYLFVTSALLVVVMILCVETVATGLRDLILLRPNMESMVALSGLLSVAHAISILVFPQWEGYYPYSAVSAVSIAFAAFYRQKLKMAQLRSFKTVAAMAKPYLVVSEKGVNGGADAAVKYKAVQPRFFVHQTEKRDLAHKTFAYAAPLLIILSIVCAAVSSIGTGQPQRFLWNFSAMVAAAAPLTLCLPFNLPFAKAAKHLGMMGEAIAGWSAAEEFAVADSLIVTDTDLFPPGCVTLNGLKIFGGYAVDRVISYSASLVAASGAGTARPFMELLHDQSAALRKVVNFKHYENGGIGGDINGESVVAGSASFMLRTGIKIPQDINIKNAIYIAINQELAGIFAVNYTAQAGVKKAINILRKNGITPVLAIRDFNVTPAMIESKFNISTDTADFPPIEERLSLSNPDRIFLAKPSAVISREGLGHYAECVVCARNLRKTVRICLGLTLASILIGMLLMFYLIFTHAPVQASPANLLTYMLLWLIPNLLAAGWVKM